MANNEKTNDIFKNIEAEELNNFRDQLKALHGVDSNEDLLNIIRNEQLKNQMVKVIPQDQIDKQPELAKKVAMLIRNSNDSIEKERIRASRNTNAFIKLWASKKNLTFAEMDKLFQSLQSSGFPIDTMADSDLDVIIDHKLGRFEQKIAEIKQEAEKIVKEVKNETLDVTSIKNEINNTPPAPKQNNKQSIDPRMLYKMLEDMGNLVNLYNNVPYLDLTPAQRKETIKIAYEKQYNSLLKILRTHGLSFDDIYNDYEEIKADLNAKFANDGKGR